MKTAKTFRLSEQAVNNLQIIGLKTGTNETAIVEIALALFGQAVIAGGMPAREEDSPPADPALAWEMGIPVPPSPPAPPKHKKRKRH
jgi:hypothetical protein